MSENTSSNSIKVRVRGTYIESKTKKGFKGYWQMQYVLHDIVDVVDGSLITSIIHLNDVACIKGKNFKRGDLLEFDATLSKDAKNKYKVTRPKNLRCVGHIDLD